MQHKTKCSGCQNVTVRTEKFTDICVSVPKEIDVLGQRTDVQGLVQKMLQPEQLSGDNQYSCDTCKGKRDASRWIELTRLPSHLMVVMHKFSFNVKTLDFAKEKTIVHTDAEPLVFPGFANKQYEVYASILHYGDTPMKGHYVAIGKRSNSAGLNRKKWVLIDDSKVDRLSEHDAMERISGQHKISESAYVLFYKSSDFPAADPRLVPRISRKILDEAHAIEQAAVHL